VSHSSRNWLECSATTKAAMTTRPPLLSHRTAADKCASAFLGFDWKRLRHAPGATELHSNRLNTSQGSVVGLVPFGFRRRAGGSGDRQRCLRHRGPPHVGHSLQETRRNSRPSLKADLRTCRAGLAAAEGVTCCAVIGRTSRANSKAPNAGGLILPSWNVIESLALMSRQLRA
jgi:hypothetical protein